MLDGENELIVTRFGKVCITVAEGMKVARPAKSLSGLSAVFFTGMMG